MKGMEIEVKFHIARKDDIRHHIMELGAISLGRFFETNLRFEDRNHSLEAHRSLLRLRRDSRVRLTHKSPPVRNDGEFKIRREIEIEVSSFDQTRQLLEQLGYRVVQVYEKWRETFQFERVAFCLDEMPFGTFLELEGEPDAIRTAAAALDLPWPSRILTNYLHIFSLLRQHLDLPFTDVTFDNFAGAPVDIKPLLAGLRSGPSGSRN
jgi:adenylate cyclase class 2